tara:strand:+ start:132 stop:428 length:297 start_codon:yes stop_codon:yes gene_type:complete
MSSYTIHDTQLKHADGTHNLEIEIDGDQAVIYFGSSFTLRLTEKQVDKLRDVLYDTSRELAAHRYDRKFAELQAEASEQQKVDLWSVPEEDGKAGDRV